MATELKTEQKNPGDPAMGKPSGAGPKVRRSPMVERGKKSHEAIVEAASRLFRRHGVNGIGVDGVMRGAGLTHGGFYAHFKNKDALVAEALEHAFREAEGNLVLADGLVGDEWLAAACDRYLSRAHLLEADQGPVIPAIGADVARAPPAVQAQFARSMEDLLARLDGKLLGLGLDAGERRQLLLAALSRWVGAVTIARALGPDHPMVDEVLRAGRTKRSSTPATSTASTPRSRPPQPALQEEA